MNKRLVLIDEKVVNPSALFGFGLPSDLIHLCSEFYEKVISGDGKKEELKLNYSKVGEVFGGLGEGDALLLVGPDAFKIPRVLYHYGIRGENYYDCSLLTRLGVNSDIGKGAYIKVVHESELPGERDIDFFMSPEFCKTRDFSYLRTAIVKTWEESVPFLNYLDSLPDTEDLGFDYETSGLPMEINFKITGAAIATKSNSVFFSFTEILRRSPLEYREFLLRMAKILFKRARFIWTYNVQFEQQVTWRELRVFCEFCDASVYNVLDGLHSKNYSLKWSAQRLLGGGDKYKLPGTLDMGGISPWDTDFDRLETLFDDMYYTTIKLSGVTGKDAIKKVLKCDPSNFSETKEFKDICSLYPGYEEEFKALIVENFGNPFLNIPADILGYYCCLDSFYTLEIHLENRSRYSDECRETFLDNIRLGAWVQRGGMYINEEFRTTYDRYCDSQMLWGILYASTFRCFYKINELKKTSAKLDSYTPIVQKLIKRGEFHNGDILEITKDLLNKNLDLNNTYSLGLDEGRLAMSYGPEFAKSFLDIVSESIVETKYKGIIDSGITRKKKILTVIVSKLEGVLGLSGFILTKKHENLELLIEYEKGYKVLQDLCRQVGGDINSMPREYKYQGKLVGIEELSDKIMESYFRCTSPIENAEITKELIGMYRYETVFLATIGKDINHLDGEKNFYAKRGIKTPEEGLEHFCNEWKIFCNSCSKSGFLGWPAGYVPEYPLSMWLTTANDNWRESFSRDNKLVIEIWESFSGWDNQNVFWPSEVDGKWEECATAWSEDDLKEPRFKQMRKFLINILLYKKYRKIKTTYINGLFINGSQEVEDTDVLMPTRKVNPGCGVFKTFPKFEVAKKETKRSSSGFHTIPSHMDVKDSVGIPKGFMLSYFDISSAEVRTLAFRSGDKNLINLFQTGQDVYIHTAKRHLGDEAWEKLEPGEKKKWRKIAKTLFLAVAYRMSAATLAGRLNISKEEAQGLIDTLFAEFSTVKEYIESNAAYPEKHDGLVNTDLGDTLHITDWRFVRQVDPKTGKVSIDRGKLGKVGRAGINYKIQSFSAISLAAGFNHVLRAAREQGINMSSIIWVHDSCENYFDINHLFEIGQFYEKEFMGYCYSKFGIEFKFDLCISGIGYSSFCDVKNISPTEMEIKGNAHCVLGFLKKIYEESKLLIEQDIPISEIIPSYTQNSMERFIKERQCCMINDTSKYTVKIKKLGYHE